MPSRYTLPDFVLGNPRVRDAHVFKTDSKSRQSRVVLQDRTREAGLRGRKPRFFNRLLRQRPESLRGLQAQNLLDVAHFTQGPESTKNGR